MFARNVSLSKVVNGEIKKGDKVKFSAKFIKGRDTCLRQGNLTETYYGTDPEFIVRFSKVEPVK